MVTIIREPIDKALAKFYFQASRDDYKTGVAGFIETVEHYSKTCQNPKLDRNRQCFNEYTEILGQGRVAVAQEKLATLDVIGTTETFDDFMIALSIRLGWPLDWVTYKRLKTVLDRPKVTTIPSTIARRPPTAQNSRGHTPSSSTGHRFRTTRKWCSITLRRTWPMTSRCTHTACSWRRHRSLRFRTCSH
mmetsp:Transcript_49156/g.139291  ORF Transcript_49156/g.139291 Transcript_49156/m.139291 type:complete len:190 (+) Transcript_49156:579-1148(+)